jgi:hypothetical protein
MSTPGPADREQPGLRAEPTVRVGRPPVPAPARPAQSGAGTGGTVPDEPTVTLPDRGQGVRGQGVQVQGVRQPTIEYGAHAPVQVTVGPRRGPRRRYRTWPWITAVVLALLLLGAVLLVMLLRGATIDPDVDLVGSGGPGSSVASAVAGQPPRGP